ncbi:hypothetical protein [Ascidiimonas sp. W6]|uniref:hypothetical protein n=1 Tax=Ascidiimonas meishanensis TaxID=3128903 RepID=UPI0030ED12A8
MKKKLYIVDLLEEPGHIRFVKKLIDILEKSLEVTFISSARYIKQINPVKWISLNDKYFDFSGSVGFVESQLKVIAELKRIIPNADTPILVTGFENISFRLRWNFKNPTFAFLHNNPEKSFLSRSFLFFPNRNIHFLAFETYIASYLETKGLNVHYVPHPIQLKPNISNGHQGENFIFVPHKIINGEYFKKLITYANKNDLKIYAKGDSNMANQHNVFIKPYFENYEYMLQEACFVVLDIKYDYRISGIFYESMMLNKKIVFETTSNRFSKEMVKLYQENVGVSDLELVKTMAPENSQFLQRHSDAEVLNRLLKIIYE